MEGCEEGWKSWLLPVQGGLSPLGQGEWVYAMYNGKGSERNQSILEQD